MQLSTTWIIIIVVVIFAIVFSNIMLLIQSNKPFVFPDSYKQPKKDEDHQDTINGETDDDTNEDRPDSPK